MFDFFSQTVATPQGNPHFRSRFTGAFAGGPFLQNAAAAATRTVAQSITTVPPDTKDGAVWKWSLDIQRELPSNMAIPVGYVGSMGAHTGNSIGNYNSPDPPSVTNVNSRRPVTQFFDPSLPQFGIQLLGAVRYFDSYGETFHHGMQVKLDKRYSKGLSVGVAYTLSKSHGDGENGGQEGASLPESA